MWLVTPASSNNRTAAAALSWLARTEPDGGIKRLCAAAHACVVAYSSTSAVRQLAKPTAVPAATTVMSANIHATCQTDSRVAGLSCLPICPPGAYLRRSLRRALSGVNTEKGKSRGIIGRSTRAAFSALAHSRGSGPFVRRTAPRCARHDRRPRSATRHRAWVANRRRSGQNRPHYRQPR